jgi:hypothetical protein
MKIMLIGVSILTLCMSDRARADEADAVKMIENLGGNIRRNEHLPGSPVVEVKLGDTKLTDADLKELKVFAQLTSLDLARTQVTDLGLKELKCESRERENVPAVRPVDNGDNVQREAVAPNQWCDCKTHRGRTLLSPRGQ